MCQLVIAGNGKYLQTRQPVTTIQKNPPAFAVNPITAISARNAAENIAVPIPNAITTAAEDPVNHQDSADNMLVHVSRYRYT